MRLDKICAIAIIPAMRIVSWNVNGLRAALKKNFYASVAVLDADILCLQEIKVDENSIPDLDLPAYEKFFNSAVRMGYSGTALFTKIHPKSVDCQTELDALTESGEGRVIVAEYDTFYLVNVYTPNSGSELRRLRFRHRVWDVEMLKLLLKLEKAKPVILCGDMNVAHCEIDLANPKANRFSAGFTDEEREGMANLLEKFGVDSFRKLHPTAEKCYSWWSHRAGARERNVGWRIDYIMVAKSIAEKIKSAFIADKIFGSDHAPVGMDVDL
ncbi:MAG: exodeoxyribonuclease III [Puniceicoccales bacterium]|nr:exodeoxyribonuclease III [Puniceicoccales bacterium]